MRRLLRTVKSQNGSAYIGTLIMVIVATFLLALLLSLIDVGISYSKVANYANALAENAAVEGQIDTDPDTYTTLAEKTGLAMEKLSYTWDAQYFDEAAHKLAFKKEFTVTVSYSCPLAVFGNSSPVTIPVTYVGRGASGVFWK